MKFGIFYEHQIPPALGRRCGTSHLFADRVGIDYAWEVEHHFLEEYSRSSAPEVFLAACSQRTKRIRLGHGIVLMHLVTIIRPASPSASRHSISSRMAEFEFGTGESASILELGGYRVTVADKRAAWREALEQCLNMMVMAPYPGLRVNTSRCLAAMWCLNRCRSRIRRCGSPAPIARQSSSRRSSASGL